MSILNFNSAPAAGQRTPFAGMTGVNQGDRPKAMIWLNLGYEINGKFVNLPIGIPVDTMEPAEARGQNVDWVKFQTSRNELLKALQGIGATLAPGEETVVPNLVIKLRRVNGELDVTKEENEYAVDFGALFAAPAQVAAE